MTQALNGMEELASQLEELAKKTDAEACREALDAGARIVTEAVRNRAPVRTGKLQDKGITYEVKDETVAEIGWTKDGFYGRFHEYGTSKMAARPYMRPAFEASKEEACAAMREKLSL